MSLQIKFRIMKKIFLLLIFSLSVQLIIAQNNLEFNKVVNVSMTVTSTYGLITAGNITVPDGKVWKINYVSYVYINGGEMIASYVTIDDFAIHNLSPTGASSTFPIWMPKGTFIVKLFRGSSSSSGQVIIKISAIEFNVVSN